MSNFNNEENEENEGLYCKYRRPSKETRITAPEKIFEDHLKTLKGKWNRLTKEEEDTIVKIAKRFNS